jgi:hypothetical protein
MTDPTNYPEWFYYPSRTGPPDWVHELVDQVHRFGVEDGCVCLQRTPRQ